VSERSRLGTPGNSEKVLPFNSNKVFRAVRCLITEAKTPIKTHRICGETVSFGLSGPPVFCLVRFFNVVCVKRALLRVKKTGMYVIRESLGAPKNYSVVGNLVINQVAKFSYQFFVVSLAIYFV
jgi:hypothetical protein